MIRNSARLAVLVLLAGCVSEDASKSKDGKQGESVLEAKGSTESEKERQLRLGQTMLDLDKRVDRFVMLSSQPGEEARQERNILGPAIGAQVATYESELIAMVSDASNPERRRVAAKALAFSQNPAAVPGLVKALEVKGDVRLLTNATYALGRIRSPATDPAPLLALLRDGDPDVRSNALMALWHVFDARRAVGASPLDPVAQREAMLLLEAALFDPADPLIRAQAAAAIGALGDPRGVDPLLNLLKDEHPLVRTQTAIALGKLGDDKAIPALLAVMDSTPSGTPKRAVVLSLTSLLEKKGIRVPDNLGDESRSWKRFVKEEFASPEK
jgi:hypothetical protein